MLSFCWGEDLDHCDGCNRAIRQKSTVVICESYCRVEKFHCVWQSSCDAVMWFIATLILPLLLWCFFFLTLAQVCACFPPRPSLALYKAITLEGTPNSSSYSSSFTAIHHSFYQPSQMRSKSGKSGSGPMFVLGTALVKSLTWAFFCASLHFSLMIVSDHPYSRPSSFLSSH